MIINAANIAGLFTAYKTRFNNAFEGAKPTWGRVAMEVPSGTKSENYSWLGEFPGLREWIGDRHIKNLAVRNYEIRNRKFEATVSVPRDDIADDQHGVFGPIFAEMGRTARMHPDELVYALLQNGFSTICYDNQNFFDTDHPVTDVDGQVNSVSNMQAGPGPAWFLIDSSREIMPIILQVREKYEIQTLFDPADEHVFMRDEYLYGVRARTNAGLGLWQLAFGSKADLTPANYEAARAAMQAFKGDEGKKLGLMPDTLVVGASLEKKGREVVVMENDAAGASNVWFETAELIVTPFLD